MSKGESAGVAVGKGSLETGQAPPMDGEVRVGSASKTFVAVVVMQLVQEGKVGLDEPIETYLPGLIRGEGIDGSKITVRQLLQHTSGLPDFDETLFGTTDVFQYRYHYVTPRDVLDSALSKPAQFEPGTQWKYTNTNYIVLGMLVERVSQRPVGEQIDQRIVKKLGLSHTYFPAPGEEKIRGTHPRGYHLNGEGKLEDITEMDPAWAWAAGAMVSTPGELNTFFQAVFDGRLLTQASIDEMKKGVVLDREDESTGLASWVLRCPVGALPGATEVTSRAITREAESALTVQQSPSPLLHGPRRSRTRTTRRTPPRRRPVRSLKPSISPCATSDGFGNGLGHLAAAHVLDSERAQPRA